VHFRFKGSQQFSEENKKECSSDCFLGTSDKLGLVQIEVEKSARLLRYQPVLLTFGVVSQLPMP
jgi:hypothetical protein